MKVPFMNLSLQNGPLRLPIRTAIMRVVASNRFYGGEVEAFEEEWAGYCGAKYCIACSSGTSALELALRAYGIGPGDDVVVPTNTFIATAEAVTAVGAGVQLADVDPRSYCITVKEVQQVQTSHTRAIIPVYLYGQAFSLLEFARAFPSLYLIVDAAQAHGAWLGLRHVGSEEFAHATCFSFYPTKNLGAMGDAGAVVTDDLDAADLMRAYRDHGRIGQNEHPSPGYNHRMDAIQAAVLRIKLPHLDEWNYAREALARRYTYNLGPCAQVTIPAEPPAGSHAFHLYAVLANRRNDLRAYLEKAGVGTGIHYPKPLHKTGAYHYDGHLPVAEVLAPMLLSLPLYPGLKEGQVDYVCDVIREFYREVRD